MADAQNKIVSIEAFRATRPADRATSIRHRAAGTVGPRLSPRSIEHRERMLHYLLTEAAARAQRANRCERNEAQEVQGRLLL